jgi:hypothetical protein
VVVWHVIFLSLLLVVDVDLLPPRKRGLALNGDFPFGAIIWDFLSSPPILSSFIPHHFGAT